MTGAGNDFILGGTAGDIIYAGAGQDMVFGDHGLIQTVVGGGVVAGALPLSEPKLDDPFIFTAIDTQNSDDGGDDIIYGQTGQDIILGQQGDDRMWGGSGDDDMTGGHNVAGGYDGRF